MREGFLVGVVLAAALIAPGPPGPTAAAAGGSPAPTQVLGFGGQDMLHPFEGNVAPSDSTGAIGTDRYVELVNQRFGVYDRAGTLLASGPLSDLSGLPGANLLDSEVIWDPDQDRFFYSMIDTNADFTSSSLAFGFSKTNLPDVDGWCNYTSTFGSYGSDFPDFPRLGDTQDFVLIGVNRFGSGRRHYLGSDLAWYAKPAPGPVLTCPDGATFLSGLFTDLRTADGHRLFSPVPANQIDSGGTGYVLGTVNAKMVPEADSLTMVTVTRDPGSGAAVLGPPVTIPVGLTFSVPPPAPQAGTTAVLETLDARLTQAVAAVDPARVDPRTGAPLVAVWTQHTVAASAGGLGSEIRWYEVDPLSGSLFQSGIVQSPRLFVFNGAVSPDRMVNGATAVFGRDMVLGFDTSSATTDVAIQMVSKVGGGAQSPFVLIEQSPGPNVDRTCARGPSCRWGDFSGASPDPAASAAAPEGVVWLTNTYNEASQGDRRIDWLTWNWAARP